MWQYFYNKCITWNVQVNLTFHLPIVLLMIYGITHSPLNWFSPSNRGAFLWRRRCQFCLLLSHFLDWIGLIQKKIIFASNLGSFFSESLIHTGNLYFECKFTAWWQCDEFSFYLSIIGFIACERDHNCTWILPDCLIATMTVKFHFGKL